MSAAAARLSIRGRGPSRTIAADASWRLAQARGVPGERRRMAIGSALALLIGAAGFALTPPPPAPVVVPPQAPLELMLLPPPPDTPAPPAEPPPIAAFPPEAPPAPVAEPEPVTLPPLVTAPPPSTAPEPATIARRPPAPRPPPRPAAVRSVPVAPAPAPPAPAPPVAKPPAAASPTHAEPAAPAQPSPGAMAAFQAGMRRAVHDALVYPPAARMAGQTGEVRVGFDFLDGSVSNVAVAAPSGLPLLDRAALATVQAAHYPQPPPELAHRPLHLAIAVHFSADRPD